MNDWTILNNAFNKNDFETMGDIFYKHSCNDLALKSYKKAFNYAKEITQLLEQEVKDPFNTPSMQQCINDVYDKHEKTCIRIIRKIKNL